MTPGLFTLVAHRGASFVRDFQVTDDDGSAWDLTGYTASFALLDVDGAEVTKVSAAQGSPGAELTVHATKTIAETTSGTVTVSLGSARTVSLPTGQLRYQLDLIPPTGGVYRLLVGELELHDGVAP